MTNIRRVIQLILFLILLLSVATTGYMILLDLTFLDALYMTIITISTVGYTEVAEMTPAGQVFTIFVIVTSVGTVGFVLSKIGSFFKRGYFSEKWRETRMLKAIEHMENHYIVAGAGETGNNVIKQFLNRKVPFVVIESDQQVIDELVDKDVNCIHGDATHEDVLERARIHKAKGFVAALSKDADNLFAVLTARQMNAALHIVARAIDHTAPMKLKRAGANFTISPNEIGGRKMAAMMLKPSTTYFMDNVIHTEDITLDLEEIEIHENSELCDKPLKKANISGKTGLIVLAIKHEEDDIFRFNPGADEYLKPKDKIIVIGQNEQIEMLRDLAKDLSDDG